MNIRTLVLIALSAFALPAMGGSPAMAAVRIVVPVHDIARGDVIGESDLTYATVQGDALMSGVATSMEAFKGKQARRMLAAGQPFRSDDVRRPVVVTRGQTITMQFSAPGVELTAMGRAMGEGGVGDTVAVQNLASYRMVSATIVAPGIVRANGGPISPVLTRR